MWSWRVTGTDPSPYIQSIIDSVVIQVLLNSVEISFIMAYCNICTLHILRLCLLTRWHHSSGSERGVLSARGGMAKRHGEPPHWHAVWGRASVQDLSLPVCKQLQVLVLHGLREGLHRHWHSTVRSRQLYAKCRCRNKIYSFVSYLKLIFKILLRDFACW